MQVSLLQAPEIRPPCAGIGDEDGVVFSGWDCLVDIATRRLKMPFDACVNDNLVGHERRHARESFQATKMLSSLMKCCWKPVRFGHRGDPATQEKALIGNVIFFAQPTANVPSLELPPLPKLLSILSKRPSPEARTT